MRAVRGSLRWRLVAVGTAVVAVVVITLDVFVYLQLRDRLEDTLQVVLRSRLEVATQLADEFGVEGLGDRLADAGIPGVVARGDGVVEEAVPQARRFVELPPDLVTDLGNDVELASMVREDGTIVEVAASRAGVTRTLRTIAVLEGLGSLAVILLSGVLLHRAAGLVLRPIDRLVAVARSTAAGRTGERLVTRDPGSELGRMTIAFNEMLDAQETALVQAREAEQRSRTFLSEAAHQLRTPVAGLRAASEAMVLADHDTDRDALAVDIGHASARAGRLVSRLLRMAELDEGAVRAHRQTDIGQLVREEVELVRSRHADVELTMEMLGDTRAAVDEVAIREAVANLLDNARRHGRPPVEVTVRGTTYEVEVRVADSGAGVAHADRERVFDRFTSLKGEGSGLGLAIVRAIAESHDGRAVADDHGFVLVLARS